MVPDVAISDRERDHLRRRFDDYHRTGDTAVRDELVSAHLRLAVHLARRFDNRGVPLDDLIQVASLGLLKAVERFDSERGLEFSTFATPTVVGELKRYFRDKGWSARVPRRVQDLHVRLNVLVGELTHQLGRSQPTPAPFCSVAGAAHLAASNGGRGLGDLLHFPCDAGDPGSSIAAVRED